MNKALLSLSIDNFNTENFGVLMGNVLILEPDNNHNFVEFNSELSELIDTASKDGYKHLTLKVPSNLKSLIRAATNQNMYLADTLVRYTFVFDKSVLPTLKYKCEIKDCVIEDLPPLKEISKSVFKIDRFHSDDSLSKELSNQYYEKWIENSFNGLADKIIVAHYNNEPVGYTTIKYQNDERFTQMVLSAVSDKYKGLGTFTSMIHYGTQWLYENFKGQSDGIIVGTQIDNVAVQRAWIKLGYSMFDSSYVFQISL